MVNEFKFFLNNCINEENIPHAFLIETNNIDKSLDSILQILIKNNIIMSNNIENNCDVKVIKPSNELITNIINKDQVIELQNFLNTKSMDNNYKVYFILYSEMLNISAANKLLKTIEEPGDKILGFLLTLDINLIIPTIKSRCEIFRDSFKEEFDPEIINISEELKNKLDSSSYLNNYDYKKILIKNDRIKLILIIKYLKNLYEKDLTNCDNIKAVANKIKILDNILMMLYANTNIELVLDKIFIELGN